MKNIIILFVLFSFIFSSCKKEENVTPVPAIAKVKTRTISATGIVHTFTYDSQGRLVLEQSSSDAHTNYTYTDSTVIVETFTSSGASYGTFVNYLNADGLVDSVSRVNNGMVSYSKYTFDAERHVILSKEYDTANTLSHRYYYTYENNNQVTFRNIMADATFRQEFNYTRDNTHTNTLGNKNFGVDFYGTDSQNPLTQIVHFSSPSFMEITDYSYTYDSEGRISTQTQQSPSFNTVITYTYY